MSLYEIYARVHAHTHTCLHGHTSEVFWQCSSPPLEMSVVCNEPTHQLLKGRHRNLWAVGELDHCVTVHLTDEVIILSCEV